MFRLPILTILLLWGGVLIAQNNGLERLNPAINSRNFDEISPKVSPDGKTLYFTRIGYPVYDKTLLINGMDWGRTAAYSSKLRSIFQSLGGRRTTNIEQSDFNQDIWFATSDIGVFDKLHHASYPLNNALPNSVCSFSADGQSMYVINKFGRDGGMEPGFSVAKASGLGWSFPSPLDISDFYTKQSGVHMSMSEDEKIIVMSLMRDDSHGGTDLYVSFRKAPGQYSVPINLGPSVNTEHNEEAPFICTDNKTMYFSSDRPGIYGGKDIYKAIRLDVTWESWGEATPLSPPINSRKDDNQPFYHPNSSYMYFVSNREVSSDIYRLPYSEVMQEKDPPSTTYTEEEPGPVKVYSYYNTTTSNNAVARTRSFPVEVIDASNGQSINAEIKYAAPGVSDRISTRQGKATLRVSSNDVYLSSSLEGYMTYESEIPKSEVVHRSNNNQVYRIAMDPIKENGKVNTDAIYFAQSKPEVLEASYNALNKLARSLEKHWNVSVLIKGHTDNQGEAKSLLELSQARAKAIKSYLVGKGISPLRIATKGMGDQEPMNDNSTEALREANRRVEIIITKVYRQPKLTNSTKSND